MPGRGLVDPAARFPREKTRLHKRRAAMRFCLILSLLFFSLPAHASETPSTTAVALQIVSPRAAPAQSGPRVDAPPDETVIFGLTGPQLAAGVAIGAGLGAAAVAASGNTLAGAGLGTLAAIYVAHLLVEAVVVGGVFSLWPSEEDEAGDLPSRKMPIRGRRASAAPLLPLQLFREASRCHAC
jgi:hypothetical protein